MVCQAWGGARGMREADQIDALIGMDDSWPGCAMLMVGASSPAIVMCCAAPGAASDRTI